MGKLHGRSVLVQDNNIERALRKLKKKIQASNILNDLREKEHYIKPTTARKLKRSAAKNRWRKQLAEQALPKKQF
jgi:small subunit ribosomal protein S21